MTPTARTLKVLKAAGWLCGKVESWNPWCKMRHDLYGMFDYLALKPGELVGVQITSGSNHAARIKKLLANPALSMWLSTGQRAEVRSWSKRGGRWVERVTDMGELVSQTKLSA